MGLMRERIFQQEIRDSVLTLWPSAFYHKLTDTPIFKGSKIRFSHPKPFDCFFVIEGVFYALELKQFRENAPIPFTIVKPHQIEGLLGAERGGGAAYILINYRITSEKNGKAINQTIAIKPELWKKVKETAKSLSASSLRFKQIKQWMFSSVEIERITIRSKRVWNLIPLLKG